MLKQKKIKFIFFNNWAIIKKMRKILGKVFYSFTETVGIVYNKIINILNLIN